MMFPVFYSPAFSIPVFSVAPLLLLLLLLLHGVAIGSQSPDHISSAAARPSHRH